jgi:2',3'-cyclic-nucleotide 2'-phosphodiesterase / 3'-nucleotidase
MAKIPPPFPSAGIHILETTDLHMQLLPFDYFTEKPAEGSGLIALVQNISDIRAKAGSGVFLFDNGDFLQGNPTADFVASLPEDDTDHPMIAAMNALDYDAVALGNREFNYGLPFLDNTIARASPYCTPTFCGPTPPRSQPPTLSSPVM